MPEKDGQRAILEEDERGVVPEVDEIRAGLEEDGNRTTPTKPHDMDIPIA